MVIRPTLTTRPSIATAATPRSGSTRGAAASATRRTAAPDITRSTIGTLAGGRGASAQSAKEPADPLLLLPLRLEYRCLSTDVPLKLASPSGPAAVRPGTRSGVRAAGSRAAAVDAKIAARKNARGNRTIIAGRTGATASIVKSSSSLKISPLKLPSTRTTRKRREIWFRWYPDDVFTFDGIADIDAVEPQDDEATKGTEALALQAFNSAIGQSPWYDVENDAVLEAWQSLAADVGLYRGVHLLRQQGVIHQDAWHKNYGKILALPRRVSLFAVTAGRVQRIALGKTLRPGVKYNPDAVSAEKSGWLSSFANAVANGMGVKITDPGRVQLALDADWLVAIGLRSGDSAKQVEDYLRDAAANGNAAFLRIGTSTNNIDGSASGYQSRPKASKASIQNLSYAERRDSKDPENAADLLAMTLGLDAKLLYQLPGADNGDSEDAKAMAVVLLPALLESAFTSHPIVQELFRDQFDVGQLTDYFAAYISARGALAPMRLGQSAYGVMPLSPLENMAPPADASDSDRKIFEYIKLTSGQSVASGTKSSVRHPVIEPDDGATFEKLEAILKLSAVSTRLDVTSHVPDGAEADDDNVLGCPYVYHSRFKPAVYLNRFLRTPAARMPDPTAKTRAYPLLYRLIRLSLGYYDSTRSDSTVSATRPGAARLALGGSISPRSLTRRTITDSVRRRDTSAGGRVRRPLSGNSMPDHVNAALRRLKAIAGRDNGVAQLETLMMEILDLLHYRADAWATGLAYYRLVKQRDRKYDGLRCGYYGFLGQLQPKTKNRDDGYMQAPSVPQAVSAGLMRSAHLRFGQDSAFAINLNSTRSRRARVLLDSLRQGLTLREVLGYVAERWLKESGNSGMKYDLRLAYPIKLQTADSDASSELSLIDGSALLDDSANAALPAAMRNAFAATLVLLRKALDEDLDCVSDLVMAEAVHQMAAGNVTAANAWQQVLSGGSVPTRCDFIRTVGEGQASTHRVTVLLDPAAASGGTPRSIVEPALGALARDALPNFGRASLQFTVNGSGAAGEGRIFQGSLSLARDLGMTPLDFLIGGKNEVIGRGRNWVLKKWRQDEAMTTALGPLPAYDLNAHINQTQPLTFDFDAGRMSVNSLVGMISGLVKTIGQARPLAPADMNNAALPKHKLDAAAYEAAMEVAHAALRARAIRQNEELQLLRLGLKNQLEQLETVVFQAHHALDNATATPAIRQARLTALETSRNAWDDVLTAVSGYGLPQALQPYTTTELLQGWEILREHWQQLAQSLTGKSNALAAAAGQEFADLEDEEMIEAAIRELVAALQNSVDGEGMKVYPPFARISATTPEVQPDAVELSNVLDGWTDLRPILGHCLNAAERLARYSTWLTGPEVTGIPQIDPTDQNLYPLSHHDGVFISRLRSRAAMRRQATYCGLVVDEWSEQQPSDKQITGLAVNYNAPQNEAPNVLLLGLADTDGKTTWTERRAADVVIEAIRLMQVRALPTEAGQLLPSSFNSVDAKKQGNSHDRRVPTGKNTFSVFRTARVRAGRPSLSVHTVSETLINKG